VSLAVPGVGVELRFLWKADTRSTQVYRNSVELAAASERLAVAASKPADAEASGMRRMALADRTSLEAELGEYPILVFVLPVGSLDQ
jgi:hypothetical protein